MIKLKDLTQEYLASFPLAKKENDDDFYEKKSSAKKELEKKVKKGALASDDLDELSAREQAEITLTKVLPKGSKMAKELKREEEPILDQYSWKDLNLICGNASTPDKNLLNHVKRTRTAAGSAVMASQMVNPHTNLETIQEKQATTKYLGENKKIAQNLDRQMEVIQKGESTRLSLWKKDNPLSHKEYKKELDSFYFKRLGLGKYNTSKWMLQLSKFWLDIRLHQWLTFMVIFSPIIMLYGINSSMSGREKADLFFNYGKMFREEDLLTLSDLFLYNDLLIPGSTFFFYRGIAVPTRHGMTGLKDPRALTPFEQVKEICADEEYRGNAWERGFAIFWQVYTMLAGFWLLFLAYRKFRKKRGTLHFLALHLIPFQDLVLKAKAICKMVDADPKLKKVYGKKLERTRQLLFKKSGQGTPAGELLHNLEVLNLKNRWYFFSFTGRMLATHKLLEEHKNILADIVYEMGEVDVALSLCKLVEESKTYCPENSFIHGELTSAPNTLPLLHMEKMWNVGIDAKQVVTNDLQMNAAEGVRTLILTGPNAGGKSVYILGIGSNAVLHQAFGIVASKSCQQSIFYKIITYVNPTQNLAQGLSLAEAGMEVLKKHKAVFDRVRKPILAIVDEILNGTDPKVAADFSYKILQERNKNYPNCLTLLTTHYMNIPGLADKEKHVANKKVVVKIPGTNGRKFDYTYKIEDGIADQNIVGEMLEEKGIL